jgi:hypothetical protein
MLVPSRFVVPDDDIRWPEEMRGMKLGKVVTNIRCGKCYVDKRTDLVSVGFDFNRQEIGYGYEANKAALLKYKDKYGDMLVPCKFVVPNDDITWPKVIWGMKLGFAVDHIRRGNTYADNREDLKSIGFNFNLQKPSYGYELVRVALVNYKTLYGDMLVPFRFVVLAGDVEWPEEIWGMKLGFTVNSIRRGKSHGKNRADLVIIGFDHSPQDRFRSEEVCRKIFEEIYSSLIFAKVRPVWFISPLTSELIELDGYNEELKIAFEYQGEHHEKLSYFNNHDEQVLFEQQVRDEHKVDECGRRGITLIVIPSKYNYEDPLPMRNFIISELKRHGKLPLRFCESYVEILT